MKTLIPQKAFVFNGFNVFNSRATSLRSGILEFQCFIVFIFSIQSYKSQIFVLPVVCAHVSHFFCKMFGHDLKDFQFDFKCHLSFLNSLKDIISTADRRCNQSLASIVYKFKICWWVAKSEILFTSIRY